MAIQGLFPGPFAVGHEIASEIIAVGDGVVRRDVGENVPVPFQTIVPWDEADRGWLKPANKLVVSRSQ